MYFSLKNIIDSYLIKELKCLILLYTNYIIYHVLE